MQRRYHQGKLDITTDDSRVDLVSAGFDAGNRSASMHWRRRWKRRHGGALKSKHDDGEKP